MTPRIGPGSVLRLACGRHMSIGLRNRRGLGTNWAQWGLRLHAGERVLVLVHNGRVGWSWSDDAVWSTA